MWIVEWHGTERVEPRRYLCAYCGHRVASNSGWNGSELGTVHFLRVCPECGRPTHLFADKQIPELPYGSDLNNLPEDIQQLYSEARSANGAGAPIATVLCCRKLLMHVAVEKGAEEGKVFEYYVKYLAEKNFIPTGSRAWVDEIRKRGNEANHEIQIKTRGEAEQLIDFSEMLLKIVYEFPSRIKKIP